MARKRREKLSLEEKLASEDEVAWVDAEDLRLDLAADWVAEARKKAGLTQKELAGRLNIPQSQIARIEKHPDRTTVRTLKRVARALNVDIRMLVR